MGNFYLNTSQAHWEVQIKNQFTKHQGNYYSLLIDLPQGDHEFKIATALTPSENDFGGDTGGRTLDLNQLTPLKKGGAAIALELQQSGIFFFQLDCSQEEDIPLLNIVPKHLRAPTTNEIDQFGVGLEHFLEMELDVRFEVGRTSILVGDLVGLGQGSVIELHRFVGEDLSVYVRDTLVAKGEVVLVNERFGVRILEVLPAVQASTFFA